MWIRRSRYERDLARLVEHALGSSRGDAKSTREAVELLRAEVADLRKDRDTENHAARTARIVLSTVVMLVVSVWLILHGAAGLRNPSSSISGSGNLSVAIEADRPTSSASLSAFDQAVIVGVAASFEPDEQAAFYDIYFPKEFVGRKYALLLQDNAILRKIVAGSSTQVASQSCANSGGSGENAFSIPHRCQIIYGVVPQVATTDDLLRNLIAPESCNISEVADQYSRPHVQIWGDLEKPILNHIDWAHDAVTLPSLLGGIPDTPMNRWDGIALNGWYGTGLQEACKNSNVPLDSTITDADPTDPTVEHYAMGWFGRAAVQSSSFVAKKRDSDSTANKYIAVGGILAGLAVGFVPVAYEATRSWRKQRKPKPAQD
jgi:hypothetical protein